MYKNYGLEKTPKPTTSATVSVKSNRKEFKPHVTLEQTQVRVASVLKPKNLNLIFKIIGFVLVVFLLIKMGGCIASHMNNKAVVPKKQFAQVLHHDAVVARSEDNKVEVAVRAVKDTWIQVKADDRIVFETTLSKGSMETWDADDHIELSGRHIEQLDMEVNGRHVGSLGGGERRIRKVLITKEGLTVKK
jgi:hypothetical protein